MQITMVDPLFDTKVHYYSIERMITFAWRYLGQRLS